MNETEYRNRFSDAGEAPSPEGRAARSLALALDIRKFEIDLYWKRATYFWAFIATAFGAFVVTFDPTSGSKSTLSLVFSGLGLVFATGWFLVNKGSKFWQNNWERHVDMLEDLASGPLYKVLVSTRGRNWVTAADRYSVSKINQVLSLFVVLVFLAAFAYSIGLCISFTRWHGMFPPWLPAASKVGVVLASLVFVGSLFRCTTDVEEETELRLELRKYKIVSPPDNKAADAAK
jgi:hypothetical protein